MIPIPTKWRQACLLISLACAATGPLLADDGQTRNLVQRQAIDDKTFSGMTRCLQCDAKDARDLGMTPTGLEPQFIPGSGCRTIDEGWAIDYLEKRGRVVYHGGIDIPAPRGTPILAVADGEFIAAIDDLDSPEGLKIYLRHAPADTGHPYWIYTEYAHLLELPAWKIGQRIKIGDEVGKTSNTGLSGQEARARNSAPQPRALGGKGRERRDAVHFAVLYSEDPNYAIWRGRLIPVGGRWMDPVALYRKNPPFESAALHQLPLPEKRVSIPFRLLDGETMPGGSKLIWPYACARR